MSITVESASKPQDAVAASDAPSTGETADASAPAQNQEQGETPEESDTEDVKDDVESDEDGSEESEEESQEDQKPKRKNGFKKRIDKLNSRLSQKDQELEALRAALRARQPEEKPQAKSPQTEANQSAERPKVDDFETHEEFIEALVDWKAEQKLQAKEAKDRAAQVKSEQQKVQEAHLERVNAFKKEAPDFEEVVADALAELGEDFRFSVAVEQLLVESDLGPQLVYELAKNPKECARICSLPALAAAKEMGKLETRIQSGKESAKPKAEVKKTNAPPPIKPVGAKASASTKTPDEMSYDEYKRWRAEQTRRG